MAKKTGSKKRKSMARKKPQKEPIGAEREPLGAEKVQETILLKDQEKRLYGEEVMQFHVKANDDDNKEGTESNIEVSRPLGKDGQPWRPIVCKWYVEKGPVYVKCINGSFGRVEWGPYKPQ